MNTEAGNKLSFKGQIVMTSGIKDGYITIENGYIIDVGELPPDNHIVDMGNAYILPGFIDLHIHGIHTSLVDDGPEALTEICRALPQYGVTGFLPTVAPRPKGEDEAFLSGLVKTETQGAEILGFHLEGPFLKITGALNSDAIAHSDADRVRSLINAAKPYKAIFSISPDVEGIETLIPLMADNDTPVFMTHTAANVEETQRAIELGACHATHFYDVFPCPEVTEAGVRPCGAVEAILADERVSVDFILDGVHVNPVAIKMALACKAQGPGKVCLITDANVGAGLEPGRFVFGNSGEIYFSSKGSPARSVENNTLAGSGLTMDQALRNAMKWLGISLVEASKLLSANPAKVLDIDHKKGKLSVGYDADFVVIDEKLEVLQTWIKGKCFFGRK
ncbi:N-acetylglucosamine-6-phosphate deacetylase [uncultured Proteiniphilum sp.]|uniref:N-acetylglucosamine-6-phosphate deacetylase n=1 Tax=uncultured Proteiniphilum sp. TaxID=497637 RepID=UPI00262006BC|nr:N-acetylglucosamine-6-phosphate deacetylase [uncultured Proteiniphilum sp.]